MQLTHDAPGLPPQSLVTVTVLNFPGVSVPQGDPGPETHALSIPGGANPRPRLVPHFTARRSLKFTPGSKSVGFAILTLAVSTLDEPLHALPY